MIVLETLKKIREHISLTKRRGITIVLESLTNDMQLWAEVGKAIRVHLPQEFYSIDKFSYHADTTHSDRMNLLDQAIKSEKKKR